MGAESAFLDKLLTVYGPMSMGWVVAAMLWQERKQDRLLYIQLIQRFLVLQHKLSDALHALKENQDGK